MLSYCVRSEDLKGCMDSELDGGILCDADSLCCLKIWSSVSMCPVDMRAVDDLFLEKDRFYLYPHVAAEIEAILARLAWDDE